jgi:hypothetical protein
MKRCRVRVATNQGWVTVGERIRMPVGSTHLACLAAKPEVKMLAT